MDWASRIGNEWRKSHCGKGLPIQVDAVQNMVVANDALSDGTLQAVNGMKRIDTKSKWSFQRLKAKGNLE